MEKKCKLGKLLLLRAIPLTHERHERSTYSFALFLWDHDIFEGWKI